MFCFMFHVLFYVSVEIGFVDGLEEFWKYSFAYDGV